MVQVHFFCNKKNPIPSLDQSVAKHVGLFRENVAIPFKISSFMVFFDSLNNFSKFSSQ